jgi:hypothetical protein
LDSDGKFIENAVKVFGRRFNNAVGEFHAGMDMDELLSHVTVQSIADGVSNLLDSLPESCTNCGAQSWKLEDETRIQCSACSEFAAFANGDDLIDEWLTKVQEQEKIF